jgi:hypothetical protein
MKNFAIKVLEAELKAGLAQQKDDARWDKIYPDLTKGQKRNRILLKKQIKELQEAIKILT